jgi:hypothetical protein
MRKPKIIQGFISEPGKDPEVDISDKEDSEGLDQLEFKWQKKIDAMILDYLGETEYDLAGTS